VFFDSIRLGYFNFRFRFGLFTISFFIRGLDTTIGYGVIWILCLGHSDVVVHLAWSSSGLTAHVLGVAAGVWVGWVSAGGGLVG
jgi:hypothetical protein